MEIGSELQQTVEFAERDCLFASAGERREFQTDPAPKRIPKVNSAPEQDQSGITLCLDVIQRTPYDR